MSIMNQHQFSSEELLGPLNEVEKKNAPAKLFTCGDVGLLKLPRVAIVGTRGPSSEGKAIAKALVRQLITHQIVIVSGLAEGIDTAAHEEAIAQNGKTIAVIGTSLENFYPKQNERLQRKIMSEHLAVSQFPSGMRGSKSSFPARNRTMALIANATIIIEAGEKSGTEHQGWEAIRLGRPLFLSPLVARANHEWVQKLCYYGAEVIPEDPSDTIFEYIPMLPIEAGESLAL